MTEGEKAIVVAAQTAIQHTGELSTEQRNLLSEALTVAAFTNPSWNTAIDIVIKMDESGLETTSPIVYKLLDVFEAM